MKYLALTLYFLACSAFCGENVIYGQDNRIDLKDASLRAQILGQSVAGRIHNESLEYTDGLDEIKVLLDSRLQDSASEDVCSDERFADQHTITDCTGFLVAEDLLVTAGHCMAHYNSEVVNDYNYHCEQYSWVFDYVVDQNNQSTKDRLTKKEVYRCEKVLYATLSENIDFAIVKLARKTNRPFLRLKKSKFSLLNTSLFTIGHPSGLPMKYTDDANIMKILSDDRFVTNLDVFGGNSGSPVFNARTHEVEGLIVQGKTDYVPGNEQSRECYRVNACSTQGTFCSIDDEDMSGEYVQRSHRILEKLKEIQERFLHL